MNAQGVTPRAAMPAQPDRVDLGAVFDQKSRGFGRPPIEERASSHVCESGEQEFARILPHPPPVKSLGAKTNHLPNIQGLAAYAASTGWGWNKIFRPQKPLQSPFKK
jgi:hypothetical protein